jgi:hypothetical protein
MNNEIKTYNELQTESEKLICDFLYKEISENLAFTENKIWHKHPVWFINGNPVVGYSKLKSGIQLLFWSGQSFNEEKLLPEGKFKAANIYYTTVDQINRIELQSWLKKSEEIQWDYKNIVKHRGVLDRLK